MLSGMIVSERSGNPNPRGQQRHKTVVWRPLCDLGAQDILETGADFLVRARVKLPYRSGCGLAAGETHGVIDPDGRPEMTVSRCPAMTAESGRLYHRGPPDFPGCPFNCEFCDIVNLYGRKPRYKNPIRCWRKWNPL